MDGFQKGALMSCWTAPSSGCVSGTFMLWAAQGCRNWSGPVLSLILSLPVHTVLLRLPAPPVLEDTALRAHPSSWHTTKPHSPGDSRGIGQHCMEQTQTAKGLAGLSFLQGVPGFSLTSDIEHREGRDPDRLPLTTLEGPLISDLR